MTSMLSSSASLVFSVSDRTASVASLPILSVFILHHSVVRVKFVVIFYSAVVTYLCMIFCSGPRWFVVLFLCWKASVSGPLLPSMGPGAGLVNWVLGSGAGFYVLELFCLVLDLPQGLGCGHRLYKCNVSK